MRTTVILMIVFALSSAVQNARADMLVNGGFENLIANGGLNITPGNEPPNLAWTVVSGSVDIGSLPFSPFVLFPAFEGTQILDLNGNSRGAVSQTFATVAGATYILNFQYTDNPNEAGLKSAAISVVDVGTSSSLLSNNISHSTATNSPAFADWTSFSSQFVATGSQSRLTFTSTSASNTASGGIFIDAVSISAVPEPSVNLLWFGRRGFDSTASQERARETLTPL